MVDFCYKCGVSLPYADKIITKGEERFMINQICPYCKEFAAEEFHTCLNEDKENSLSLLNEEFIINNGKEVIKKE